MATPTGHSTAAVSTAPPAPTHAGRRQDRRLRLDEILDLMVGDGLVAAVDAEKFARLRSTRVEHPLELIADQKWKSLIPPHRVLALEGLVEWLAAKLGVRYLHIEPP